MTIGPNTLPALILGFAIIWAAYLIGSQPHGRFALGTVGNVAVRLDTQTGEMVACQRECVMISGPRIKND
jgi:hypothetical protein